MVFYEPNNNTPSILSDCFVSVWGVLSFPSTKLTKTQRNVNSACKIHGSQ